MIIYKSKYNERKIKMKNKNRYFQPKNSKEAMRQIETLFNKYVDAPLTQELVAYHQNLINRLNDDILKAAEAEGIPSRIESIHNMVDVMRSWLQIRMSNQPFNGHMEHFKYVTNTKTKFKRNTIKLKSGQNRRASRH